MSPTPSKDAKAGPKRVVLAADLGRVFGVDLLHGLTAYLRGRRTWLLRQVKPEDLNAKLLAELKPDGVIGLLYSPDTISALAAAGIAAVNLSHEREQMGLPSVFSDDRAVGRLAAEYCLERGFESFAVVVPETERRWSKLRSAGFEQTLRAGGHGCDRYLWKTLVDTQIWDSHMTQPITQWLERLPKPVAVLAVSDFLAMPLVMVCQLAGLAVPEAVSVIGVHNADIYCALAEPSLTTVDTDQRRIGYEAARILDRLFRGQRVSSKPVIIPPRNVIERESTQAVMQADSIIREAMQFIRTHAHEGFGVEELAGALTISRRRIEQRFRLTLGRTPLQVIHQARVSLAKRLLTDTDLSVKVIAMRSGFQRPDRLATVFKAATGTTPAAYRENLRSRE